MLSPLFVVTLDDNQNYRHYQHLCMLKLINTQVWGGKIPHVNRIADQHHIHYPFDSKEDAGDVCRRIGVTCTNGIIDTFHWEWTRVMIRMMEIEWLPPTIKDLEINKRIPRSGTRFSTRCVPRGAIRFEMQDSRLYESVELGGLPLHLKHLIVPKNRLAGVLYIKRLPDGFVQLDIASNNSQIVIVDNDSIPKSVEVITVGLKSREVPLVIQEVAQRQIDRRVRVKEGLIKRELTTD